MFFDCASLITVPELPATILTIGCYSHMFHGCSSYTYSPTLPALTLVKDCYNHMFYDCPSLRNVKCLATNVSAQYCTQAWLERAAL